MKKLKKLFTALLMVLCAFMFVACGEIKVFVNYGQDQLELSVKKDNAEKIVEEINKLQKDGYEIEGVYTDSTFINRWNGEDVSNKDNLYVKWIGREYNIQFNANGGTGTMANQVIRYNQSANLNQNAFTRTGYSFAGWATSANAETVEYNNLAEFNMNVKGVTLYAVWSVNTYSVSFNANGGTGTMANQNVNFGENANLTNNAYVKEGHYFTGWNTKADGSGTSYQNGASITMVDGGITLYAQWQVEKYNFVIKNGNEVIITHNNASYGENVDVMGLYGDIIAGLTAPVGTVYGGLYLESDTNFETQYLPNLNEALQIVDFGNNGDTATLVIRWAKETGTVNLNYNGATANNAVTELNLEYGDTLDALPTPTKDGKTFIGWYTINLEAESSNASNFTSNKIVTSTTQWQDNFNAIYALWADNSSAINLDLNEGNFDEVEHATSHTTNQETTLTTASLYGYDFVGWKLVEPAFVNGVYAPTGTFMPKNAAQTDYVIPANSFGINGEAIKLVAEYQVQNHTVTFKTPDGNGGYTDVLVVNGNSFTDVEDAANYNYDTLYTNMAKAGFAFDGWYKSNSNFTENYRFDAKEGTISGEDIIVYSNYVQILSAPTNVNMEQNSTMLTWDQVSGAEYYLVRIDGAEWVRVNTNQLETDLLMAIADDYTIEVQACSSYVSALNENINSSVTTKEWTRETSLQNSLLQIRDGQGKLEKYILFTGNKYTWTSANYTVSVKDLSTEGLVASSQEGEGTIASSIEANTKTGTFTFVISYADPEREDEEYLAQVVEDVNNVSYGEAYSRYLTQTDAESSQFLNTQNPTPYTVGTANGVEIDFVLTKGEVSYTEFDRTNEELLSYSFEVKQDGEYRPATEEEIPTRNTTDGKLYFDQANAGKTYRVTVKFAYSKNVTESNPYGEISNQFELTLNTGVNVYTHQELKTAYADVNVKEINVLRNIVAELSADQVHADGTPINVTSEHIFESNDTTSNNATEGTERKTDGNIYKRAYMGTAYKNDKIVVNGNYCKIDASKLLPVNAEYSKSHSSDGDGLHHQVGLIDTSADEFTLLRPHIGVFYYKVPFGQGATFNNLEIAGNKPTGDLGVKPGDEGYSEAYSARLTAESGAYSGFYIETSKVTVNNVYMYNLHHGVRMDGAEKDFEEGKDATLEANWDVTVPNNAKVETNYIKVHDMYQNGIYSWEGKEIKVYNSYFTQLNGPAVQMSNEGTPTQPIVVIDKHTVVDNYMTGSESWFSLWGLSTLANKLKAGLQPTLEGMGASVLSDRNGTEATNLIFIFQPVESVGSGILEDGTKVDNEARACSITTYFGGEKAVIDGETLSTGVKTVRDYSHFASGDMRLSGGLHAFGITPYQSTQNFAIAALVTQTFLTSSENQALTAQYALGLKTWTDVGAVIIPVPGMGDVSLSYLMAEEDFAVMANTFFEYAIVREAVVGNTTLNTTMIKTDGVYDYVISEIAKAMGITTENPVYSVFVAALKAKITIEHLIEVCAIRESDNAELISFNTIQTNAYENTIKAGKTEVEATKAAGESVAMFMLLKLSGCESIGTQAIEVGMPMASGNSIQVIYVGYGFKDQPNW